ncbi:MAG: hypothetical protein Ta2G_17360 [Termitinemataceae bacterium]|nr:MAG: hypothetical protein Ta2G_17360 [Termitinemataceae bacterium]
MKTTIFGKKAMVAAVVSMVLAFGFVLTGCGGVFEGSGTSFAGETLPTSVTLTATLKGSKFTLKVYSTEYEGKAKKASISGDGKYYDITGDKFGADCLFTIVDKVANFGGTVDGKVISAMGMAKKSVDGEEDVFEMTGTIQE